MTINKKVKSTAEKPLLKKTSSKTAAPAPVAKKGFPAKKAGAGVARKTARPAKKPLPTWQAPADFKPHFLEIGVRTDKDGLLGSAIKATRYQGRYDPDAEDKKKFDVGGYDMATLVGVQARLAGVTFRANADRKYPSGIKERNAVETFKTAEGEKKQRLVFRAAHRLPANTTFRILLRINKKSADGTISIVFKHVEQLVKSVKSGNLSPVLLDKKDPVYRAFRKANRILPAAFKNVLMPPKRTRGARVVEAEEE